MGNTFDTYVQQGETTDLGGQTELDFGNPGTKNADGTPRLARTLMSWNTEPFADSLVSSASVQLYNFHSGATDCKAQSWTVWNTGEGSGASRWTKQPEWMQQYATSTQTAGYPAGCTNTTDGWIKADVTDLVKVWASAKQTRGHMGIRAANDDVKGWKRVNSRNATANQPKLTVNYNYRPGDGTAQQAGAPFKSYAGVWAVNSTTPTLRDKFADADGDKVNGTFQVYDAATNKPITTPAGDGAIVSADVAPGAWASVKVPAGQLINGKTYKFRTNSYDGTHYNLNWSPWREFVVDTTAPGAPAKIASTDYPAGAWTPNKGDGNFDVTPPAGDDARGIESRTNGGTWSTEKPAVAGKTTTVTGTPAERDMNRTEGRAVDRADNKGSEKVYDYGTGKKPISGDTAIPDSGEQPEDPVDPEEEPYEGADTPERQTSPDGVVTDPKPGDRSNCYKTDNSDIEMCQSRTYNAEIGRAAKALAAPTNPLVPWCSDPLTGGYTLTRDEGCHKIGVVVDWWQISTNQPPKHIGTAAFLVREEIKLNTKGPKGAEWLQQNTIAPLSIDGALGTVTLDYWDANCGGDTDCKKEYVGPEFTGPTSWTTASSVTEQTVQTRKFTWQSAAAGTSHKFDRGNFLGFKASAAPGAAKVTEPSWVFWGQVRCDKKMRANTSVGCVFPKYTPTFDLKLKNAEGAALYYLEMRDKLDWYPGSKKHNSPLRREFDGGKADANRGVVCPKSGAYQLVEHPLATPDPANKNKAVQCDEYAFASTKESGGATGVSNGGECLQAYARKGGDGKWRLYDDERPPFGGTPTYKEKCARASMHGGHNETAGRRLNGFYSKQRMLDNDPYFIDAPGLVRP
ncbi:DNRLRE domain-containing protein [Streptomyces beijiangensis]|uniref:DNRLRE domain-containing protein n=1 Tax=Streptomyces beijiangensis TaxID=163361 RepID=UPI003558D183